MNCNHRIHSPQSHGAPVLSMFQKLAKHKLLGLLLAFVFLQNVAHAQAVAWEMSSEPGDQASSAATTLGSNFTNCVLSRGPGIAAVTGAGSMNSSGWFASAAATTLAQAIANGDFYEFTVNTENCLFFNPTTIKIVLRSSATGPNTATLRCSSDGFSANIGTVTVGTTSAAFTFSETISPNSDGVTYRLYGYGGAAGGGTPSAGGTMRIGTSVTASDNDLEVFASTTFVTVATVANITVNDGDFVPSIALNPNVPDATVTWSRTTQTIGLGATSGTGDIPAFTAFNNTGAAVTSTFTAHASLGNCTGPDMTFTITVNPAVCDITSVNFLGNPSACNDNGTPNDPGDDFFTQNIQANFFNRPATGNLQIVPGGDQIGTYSIPVNQIIGNSHIFNGVQLKADGTPTVITMNFTDDPACSETKTGPTVQACSTPAVCDITNVNFLGNPSACNDNGTPFDPSDDFFTQNIQANFFNRPATGSLQIVPGGDQIGTYSIPVNQIVGNSHIFNGVQLKADGTPTVITMNFTDDPACSETKTGPTVQPCSAAGPPCEVIGFSFANISSCNNNGTPNDATDDFFTVNVDVLYSNSTAGDSLKLVGGSLVFPRTMLALVGTNVTSTLSAVRFRADGQAVVFTGQIGVGSTIHCSLTRTGPSVSSCSSAPPPSTVTNVVFQNIGTCNDNGTSDPTDDFYTANVQASFVNPPATGNLEIELPGSVVPGGGATSVPVAGLTSPHTFTGVRFKANGATTVAEVQFSANQSCVRTANSPGVQPCSFAPPVLICPAAVAVSCASQVPAANPASVSETHTCPGNVSIVFVGDVNSNVVCINKLTITRTYRGTDQCGNSSTCAQTITLNDVTPPTVTCLANLQLSCATQVPAVDVSTLGVVDNCAGGVGISRSFVGETTTNQTCANRFTITRTYRGSDACGNSATCNQIIAVNDQTPPSLTCPAGQSVSCANQVPAQNTASVTGLSDNCGGATPTVTFVGDANSGQTCANRFTLTRTYRASDACGNSATCSQIISVNDQTPPTLTCPTGQTVSCAENVPAQNVVSVTGVSDNCAGGNPTVSFVGDAVSNQTCANRFTLTRTYRATDVCGNSATCVQTILVNDQTAPVFSQNPQNQTVECSAANAQQLAAFLAANGGAVASDNCNSGFSFSNTDNFVPACGKTGVHNVVFTATDVCGNATSRPATFTIVDTKAPVFNPVPQNQLLECDLATNPTALANWVAANGFSSATDCSDVLVWRNEDLPVNNNGICGGNLNIRKRFFVTDECGNEASAIATFVTQDTKPPVFLTMPASREVPCSKDFSGESEFYDWLETNAGLRVEDRCGEVFLKKYALAEGSPCENSWWKTYRFTAMDECGNRSSATATFSVVDREPPEILHCPTGAELFCVDDLPKTPTGFTQIQAIDNCSNNLKISLDHVWQTGFGCKRDLFQIRYFFKVEDKCGNAATCVEGYTVIDTTPPALILKDTTWLACVDDLPDTGSLFNFLKPHIRSCGDRFSVRILSSFQSPKQRVFMVRIKNWCSEKFIERSLVFIANGACRPFCTAPQEVWGDPNGQIGGQSVRAILDSFDLWKGFLQVGGPERWLRLEGDCLLDLLPSDGDFAPLPPGKTLGKEPACDLAPEYLTAVTSVLKSQVAAQALAMEANFLYNLKFNGRDLSLRPLPLDDTCVVSKRLRHYLAEVVTWRDFLNLTHVYLNGGNPDFPADFGEMLARTLSKLNRLHEGCVPHDPCSLPRFWSGDPVLPQTIKPFVGTARMLPNPASALATVQFELAETEAVRLVLSGGFAVLREWSFAGTKGLNAFEISVAGLPAGLYNLAIESKVSRVQYVRFAKID